MPFTNLLQFSRGMHEASSQFIKGDDECEMLNGCNVDHVTGSIVKDLGYSQVGSTLESGKKVTGLYNFRQDAATQKMLVTCNDSGDADTQLFRSTGGAWTEVAAAETAWANDANIRVEMEAMDNYCYFVGWGSIDGFLAVGSLTGTTFSTSTNVTSMPTAKYIKRYRDRIYIGNCFETSARPYRVYYSTIPSSGSITWTVATNFFDVDYSEHITGLGENWDRLVVFTEYSGYFYNQSSKKKVWDVGCSNHRTIRNSGAFMFWANRDGVWTSTGGRPLNVSAKVENFIKATYSATFTAAADNVVTSTAHGLFDDDVIQVSTTAADLPGGLSVSTNYYVILATADTFEVSATKGGASVNVTDAGTGTHTFKRVSSPIINAFAAVTDEEYRLFIGNVTVAGVDYKNTELVFNIPHQTWHIRELADRITAYGEFNNGGRLELWHGDVTSEVMKRSRYTDVNPVYADDGTAIKSHFETKIFDFGLPEQRKQFSKLLAYTPRAQGLKLFARVIDKTARALTPYKPLGECGKYINEFTINPDKGHFIQVQGRELSDQAYWELAGISIDVRMDTDKK